MTVDEFEIALNALPAALERHVREALHDHAVAVAQVASDYLGEYQRGWAPLSPSTIAKHGDTPLLDTGAMKTDISALPVQTSGATLTESIGTSLPYGVFQELGTQRIPPRSFLGLALAENHDVMVVAVDVAVGDAIDEVLV